MSRINTNVSSLYAQTTLGRTNDQLNTAMSRLSSGLRINSGKDDPAGLIASEVLRSDMTAVSQAITNTDRADQMIQTADSALGQVSNLLNDIRGLVVEAANDGALSAEQIAANQLQVDSSLEAIDRIARTTSFGGKKLLDGTQAILTTTSDSFADIDVQQVNMGASSTDGTLFDPLSVAVDTTTVASAATRTDTSQAVATDGTVSFVTNGFTFTLTQEADTAEDNISINVVAADLGGGAASDSTVAYNTGTNTLTITLDITDTAITATRLEGQLQAVTDGTNAIFENGTVAGVDVNGTGLGGAATLSTNANYLRRVHDRVVSIGGNKGTETFNFASGTTQTAMYTEINKMTESTGVVASIVSGNLTLTSQNKGSAQFVNVEELSTGITGTTNYSGTMVGKASGTDIVATVNGLAAEGVGDVVKVRTGLITADIRMSSAVVNGDTDTFTVTGGGANFQLGKDVTPGEQARIGISSVNTGTLGGLEGNMYQLRTGQNATLAKDSILAGKIVDEAILSVANTRGRLGAFSTTTLDSNKTALGDYLVNLTEAESSLRDADFAKESAALTRAQVLVQSGTSILAIANQNPQNMLALIR